WGRPGFLQRVFVAGFWKTGFMPEGVEGESAALAFCLAAAMCANDSKANTTASSPLAKIARASASVRLGPRETSNAVIGPTSVYVTEVTRNGCFSKVELHTAKE